MASAKCIIDEKNIKIFTKMVQALSKMGDELYFNFTADKVKVESVNSGQSGYACFTLHPSFFSSYTFGSADQPNITSPINVIHCKIPIKSAIFVFKSPNFERQVEYMELYKTSEFDSLTVSLHCKFSVLKTYTFVVLDSEPLAVEFDKLTHRNQLTIDAKVIHGTIMAFKVNSEEEVTLNATKEFIAMQNHLDFEPEKNLKTAVNLKNEEFDHFDIVEEMEITFCLREFRALVTFAESLDLKFSLSFDHPGGPCIGYCQIDSKLEAEFALATLDTQFNENEQARAMPITSQDVDRAQIPQRNSLGPTIKESLANASQQTMQEEDIPIGNMELHDEMMPPSPKSRKFRSRFLNISQATLHASQLPTSDRQVLAGDSDTE